MRISLKKECAKYFNKNIIFHGGCVLDLAWNRIRRSKDDCACVMAFFLWFLYVVILCLVLTLVTNCITQHTQSTKSSSYNQEHMIEHLQAIKSYQWRKCNQINQMRNCSNRCNSGHNMLIFKDSKHHQIWRSTQLWNRHLL